MAGIGCRVDLLTTCSGLLRLAHLPVTRPAIHNLRVPVASVSRPQGGGLLAVLWPQGWVYCQIMAIVRGVCVPKNELKAKAAGP